MKDRYSVAKTLETQNLTRRFARRGGNGDPWLTVVEDVSLSLGEGEIFGLLGLNGAGKTTLVRMLCGLLPPSSGQATVLGLDVQRQARPVRAPRSAFVPGKSAVFIGG